MIDIDINSNKKKRLDAYRIYAVNIIIRFCNFMSLYTIIRPYIAFRTWIT